VSNSVPLYFEAKQISVMSATPQTPGTGGVLTAATAFDLLALGIFDHFTYQASRQLFEYSPANASIENYQPGKNTFTASLGQIDQKGKTCALQDIYGAYSHLRVAGQATDPFSGTAGKFFVIIAAVGEISGGFVEGKNATMLELKPAGIDIQWATSPTI